jgi:3-oxoisoapionate decarboxylase
MPTLKRSHTLGRRTFLQSAVSAAMISGIGRVTAQERAGDERRAGGSPSALGMATATFAVRLTQGSDIMRANEASLPASAFFDLCRRFGTGGGQVGVAQLESQEPEYLKRLRGEIEAHRLFIELSVFGRTIEDLDAFDRAARTARDLGAKRLRAALLSGRRYETFESRQAWDEFTARWRKALPALVPVLDRYDLQLGIENHRDYLAHELAQVLATIGSPRLGVCVDFGNNLSLLEDPTETVSTLAPYTVTTHIKDMALRPIDRGFKLSEVPLGTGILPLAHLVDIVRKAKPDVHFCLEMITRDPLIVPYKDDRYWVTFNGRDAARIQRFEASILTRASTGPLPHISGLTPAEQVAAEDENLRQSVAYAKNTLKIT